MELYVGEEYRITTQPFNWIIEKKDKVTWKKDSFLDDIEQVKSRLKELGISTKKLSRLSERIRTVLNIEESQTSALFLTRAKHPHFTKQMSKRSLRNLKRRHSIGEI